MAPSSGWKGRQQQQQIPLSVSKHMYQITWCHNLKTLSFHCMLYLLKTTGDMVWNSRGNKRNIPFFTFTLCLSKITSNLQKTTKRIFKYGSHTSNDDELLSSCSDLDTFDDLLTEDLNQNKESFSPKTKPRRYRYYDCLVSGLYASTSPVSEDGSSCQTQSVIPQHFHQRL